MVRGSTDRATFSDSEFSRSTFAAETERIMSKGRTDVHQNRGPRDEIRPGHEPIRFEDVVQNEVTHLTFDIAWLVSTRAVHCLPHRQQRSWIRNRHMQDKAECGRHRSVERVEETRGCKVDGANQVAASRGQAGLPP